MGTKNSAVTSPPEPSLRSMDSQQFINRLKGVCDTAHKDNPSSDSRYAFFLGAGCSVSSGIPAAGALVRDSWLPRLCKLINPKCTDYAVFAQEQFPGYEPDKASSFYGQLIHELFVTPNDRQQEIERLCEAKFPGFGYAALAKLVAHKSTAFNVVLTTNFDDLMADALYLYTPARPLVIHHESLAAFIRPTRMRPLVVKLHGDSRLSPKNTREETKDLGDGLAKHIAMLLNDRGLIFMGYGGSDESILKLLAELPAEALPSGVFWLSSSEPTGKVRDWLRARSGVWVRITDFDEFMLRAYTSFEMKHPSKGEFDKMFGNYYETFRKMAERVENPTGDAILDPTLVANLEIAREELPEDFKEVARGESLAATEPARAQQVLEVVANKPGTSARAQLSAARALRDKLHKNTEALVAFESALQLTIAESGVESEDTAQVYAELAATKWRTGDLAGALFDIEKSIAWGEAQQPRDEPSLAVMYASRARIRQDRGDLLGAEADIKRSIDWGEAQQPRDERSLAILYASRARIRQERGDLSGADADIKHSIDWGEAQRPRDERSLAIDYASRAGIRQDHGDLVGAGADFQRSIDWGEAQQPRDERSLAIWYASRASVRQHCGDLAGAETDLRRSIDWGEAQQPRDERSLAIDYASRARIRQDRGDFSGAEADIQRSIEWGEAQQPPYELGLAIWSAIRAGIRQKRDSLSGAKTDIQRSIDWSEAQQPRNGLSLAILYASRASIRQDCGDLVGAEADISRSIMWFRANQPDNHRRMAINLKIQARMFAALGAWEKAKASIDESVLMHEKAFGNDHEWTVKARKAQADIADHNVPER